MSQNNSAKFAFFYLLSLVGLLFVSISTGLVIFQIINKYIIDVVDQYSSRYSSEAIKFSISSLLIATPVFYLTMNQIYKNLYSGELDKEAGVRKWLTYFILLVSSVVMIGWLIAVLNSFLDGELTTKIILKAITALGIASSIFSFYFYDIKRELVKGVKDKVIKLYFYISITVIIGAFIASLFVVESPTQTRNRKIDQAILNDFISIDNALNNFYTDNAKMPVSLEELKGEFPYIRDIQLQDSTNKTKYEFNILENKKYELCTTFLTSNMDDIDGSNFYPGKEWLHESGYQCISNVVRNMKNPELMRQ